MSIRLRLPTLALATVLLACAAASPADARTPSGSPSSGPVPDSILVQLDELGDSPRSHEFVVPIDGRIAGWTDLRGSNHYCRVDAHPVADTKISLSLRCARDRDGSKADLEFQAVRSFEPGVATRLAELTPVQGGRLQVTATRR